MGFFTDIDQLIEGYTVQLVIRKEKDKLIIMLTPKFDNATDEVAKELSPLVVSGSPAELDVGFTAAIAEGLKQTNQLYTNIADYTTQLKAADKKAAGKKEPKGISKKKEKKDSQQNIFDAKENKPEEKKVEEKPEKKEEPKAEEKKEKPVSEKIKADTGEVSTPEPPSKQEEDTSAPETDVPVDDFGDEEW